MEAFYENLAHFTHGVSLTAFCLAALFLWQRRTSRLLNFLFWEMLFWAFVQFKDVDYLIPGLWEQEFLPNIQLSIDAWCIPATILLFVEIVSPRWLTFLRGLCLVLPSLLLTVGYVIFPSGAVFQAGLLYNYVLGAVATVLVFLASSRHDNFIRKNFSHIEHITLSWMRRVILLLFLLLTAWTLVALSPSWLNDALYYLFSVVIWGIIYVYTTRHVVVETPDFLTLLAAHRRPQSDDPDPTYPFAPRLQQAMEQERMYLDPRLILADVASAVGTNRTYLSEYLNRELKTTFYDYVNAFRIRESELLLRQNREMKIEEVAERCGFNSISTFRRSFEKTNGMTPARYRRG